jgi:ubiquinone biosynthesis protein
MQIFTNGYRHIQRYHQIINVISKHGLGRLLDFIGLKSPFRFPGLQKKDLSFHSTAFRVKMVLEELGPTFIKLGQLLSIRPDLLPLHYLIELEKLQEQVTPIDFYQIKEIIESELNQPITAIFKEINPNPIAAASIGQVHSGRLLTGEAIVVKVQRPEVRKIVTTDLEILGDIARFLESRTEWGRAYNIVGLVDEFSRTIRDELDYTIEAGNADRFAKNFQADPSVRFPKVFWQYSTGQMLVLEAVSGRKVNNEAGCEKWKANKAIAAKNLVNAILKQLLIDGFFHADPHPGNIVLAPNGAILFLDFGMVGHLNNCLRERLLFLMYNLIQEDIAKVVDILIEIGDIKDNSNRKALRDEIFYLFNKYYHRPLNRIYIAAVLRELLGLARSYRFKFPKELSLIARCLFLLESTVSKITPESSLLELSRPFGVKLLRQQLSWGNLSKTGLTLFQDWLFFSLELPERLKSIFRFAENGDLKFILEHQNFDSFISKMNLVGNRLSFSLIIAAIIIGSSLIAQQTQLAFFGSFPIAEVGFIIAVLMGIWLLVSIIRTGKI